MTSAQKRALREYIFSLPGAHEDGPIKLARREIQLRRGTTPDEDVYLAKVLVKP